MTVAMHACRLVIGITLGIGVLGCESSTDTGGGGSMEQMAARLEAQNEAQQKDEQRLEAERKAEEARQAASSQPAERPRTAAGRPGVGEGGYFTAIVGARRHILNEADRWPWLQAVQHFQATHGRLPKDHAEFMSKIVEPLEINLGYKEENQEFFYDPNEGDWGELYVVEMVEEPAPAEQ